MAVLATKWTLTASWHLNLYEYTLYLGFDKPTKRRKPIRGSFVWTVDNCGLRRSHGILSPMFCVRISEWELRSKEGGVNLLSVPVATCTYVGLPCCTGRWIEAGFSCWKFIRLSSVALRTPVWLLRRGVERICTLWKANLWRILSRNSILVP